MQEKKKDVVAIENNRVTLLSTSNELLLDAQWPALTINEQRLVVYMLSMIRRDDQDFKPYQISIRDLANLFGGERNDLYERFDQATDGLMNKIIRWLNPEDKNLSLKVAWCSSAGVHKGKGLVYLNFDPQLKPFLLALKGNFTIWGEVRAVIGLKNHYSLRTYQLLKYNEGMAQVDGRRETIIELDWFKAYLATPQGSYINFSHFKAKVLEPVKKDIAAKTDIKFTYTVIKSGRKVAKLKFEWKDNKGFKQMVLPGITEEGKSSLEDILMFEFGITPDELAISLVQDYGKECVEDAILAVYEYTKKIIKEGKSVNNYAGLVRKAIEKGWKPVKKSAFEAKIIEQEKTLVQAGIEQMRQKRLEQQEKEMIETNKEIVSQEKFKACSQEEKNQILADFKEYLTTLENTIIVKEFEKYGIEGDNVALQQILNIFLKKHYFQEVVE